MQRKAFEQMHKALKPGGQLLFAENLLASSMHQNLRNKFVTWAESWRYVSLDEMHDFLKIFSSKERFSKNLLIKRNPYYRLFRCSRTK